MEQEKSSREIGQDVINFHKQEALLIHQLIAPDIDPLFLDLSTFKDWQNKLAKEKEGFKDSSEGWLSKELLDSYEKLLYRYVKVLKSEIRLKRIHLPGGHDIIQVFN